LAETELKMLKKIQRLLEKINNTMNAVLSINQNLDKINNKLNVMNEILLDIHSATGIQDNLNELNNFEYQVYSQNGEDGLLNEILNRLNIKTGFFIEIGVQDGLETNTTYLLMKGWKGLWIEADKNYTLDITNTFREEINSKALILKNEFVTTENIEQILINANVPSTIDVLSIDIDSNDYWIWEKIKTQSPRVVIIEYNAFIPYDVEWIMNYQKNKIWDYSTAFNSSLKSLEKLGKIKGYKLVACCKNGVNAFFVRKDLITGQFPALDIHDIYMPIRYYLKRNYNVVKGFHRHPND